MKTYAASDMSKMLKEVIDSLKEYVGHLKAENVYLQQLVKEHCSSCKSCGILFPIGSRDTARKDSKFCSTPCRMKWHNSRRKSKRVCSK